MAVTRAIEQEATVASEKSTRSARQPAAAWSTPAQLRKSWPIVRLLAEIWAIPQVNKIGLRVDGTGIYVRVLVPEDTREVSYRIYGAERDYLNATSLHNFDLMVTPTNRVPAGILENILAGFETVLER